MNLLPEGHHCTKNEVSCEFPADLITYTEKILKGKLHFLYSHINPYRNAQHIYFIFFVSVKNSSQHYPYQVYCFLTTAVLIIPINYSFYSTGCSKAKIEHI